MFFWAVLQAAPLESGGTSHHQLSLSARWSLVAPAGRLGRPRDRDARGEWTTCVDEQNKAKHGVPGRLSRHVGGEMAGTAIWWAGDKVSLTLAVFLIAVWMLIVRRG